MVCCSIYILYIFFSVVLKITLTMNKNKMVLQAILADKAERNDDMLSTMKLVVETWKELSSEEQRLFYVAFSRAADASRNSYLAFSHITQHHERSCIVNQVAEKCREKAEKELRDICNDVFKLLNTLLIPRAGDAGSEVFYQQMKGDFYKYLIYVSIGDEMRNAIEESRKAYQEGIDIGVSSLSPTHPNRLEITARMAIFYHSVLNSHDTAYQLAKHALYDANLEMNTLDEDSYEKCISKIKILCDILTWPQE